MSDNDAENSRNDSIRTLAIFFAGTAVGLLSFVEAVFANRSSSNDRFSDDVVVTFLLISMLFSLSVAALRRPQGNTQITDFILGLSFFTLLAGTIVFTWANQRRHVSVTFTVSFVLLAIAYLTCTDPAPNEEDHLQDRVVRYWRKWHSLGQPTRLGPMPPSQTASRKLTEESGQNSVEVNQYDMSSA